MDFLDYFNEKYRLFWWVTSIDYFDEKYSSYNGIYKRSIKLPFPGVCSRLKEQNKSTRALLGLTLLGSFKHMLFVLPFLVSGDPK